MMHATNIFPEFKHWVMAASLAGVGLLGVAPLATAAAEHTMLGNMHASAEPLLEADSKSEYTPNEKTLKQDEIKPATSNEGLLKVAELADDTAITASVKAELLKDAMVKGLKVEVETKQGVVQLSGIVENEQQAARAIEVATNVKGVKSVINNLMIKG